MTGLTWSSNDWLYYTSYLYFSLEYLFLICHSLHSGVKYYFVIMDYYLFSIHSFSCSLTPYLGDDITSIQQEITMMKECKHKNIVAYYGTYHRYSNVCVLPAWYFSSSCQGIERCIPTHVLYPAGRVTQSDTKHKSSYRHLSAHALDDLCIPT